MEVMSKMVAKWLTGIGTLALAFVAIFQDTIRSKVCRPKFQASTTTKPPDCMAARITTTTIDKKFIADAIYVRLWVENTGNAAARNVEVYAKELRRKRADQLWEPVKEFPPMNLVWADIGRTIYFPIIAPKMGKHCDIFHIVDPSKRSHPNINEENPRLNLTDQQTSMAFSLIATPNHMGHIIDPGEYRLKILIAAENARPLEKTLSIDLRGAWHIDETIMLRDGVGVSVS
jgi:hypothetical protein